MNFSAITHRPMSEYAHAIDEGVYVFRLCAQKSDLKKVGFYYADRADMSPKLSFTGKEMALVRSDSLHDWFEITLHTALLRLAYYFELDDGNSTAYYVGGCFESSCDQDRSDYFQFPFNLRANRLNIPEWVNDAIVYNIFPDSFADGAGRMSDTSLKSLYKGMPCDSLHGGTLEGIRKNIDYIASLGCNCIYLNPVFAANSYHKYDVLDYYHIDPTRGSDDDFKQLIDDAHAVGMRVIIDGVFNHVSWQHPFFQDVLKNGKASPYYSYFYELPENPRYPEGGESADYICFAYVPEMPKTNTADPALRSYFCEVGAYWVREYGADGWRLDVANEMDDAFLREFRAAVKAVKPDAIIIGEVWENAAHYINSSLLDGAMNYDFRRFCDQFFAARTIDAPEFDLRVSNMLMGCCRQALPAQLNLLDSHDIRRFLSVCGGDRDKMELAILFQMTFVGMPSLFYGDEKGLTGLCEADYRRAMRFEQSDALEEIYRRLIALRREYPALRYGSFETIIAEGGVYGYRRSYNGQIATVIMNLGEREKELSPEGRIALKKNHSCDILSKNGFVVSISE